MSCHAMNRCHRLQPPCRRRQAAVRLRIVGGRPATIDGGQSLPRTNSKSLDGAGRLSQSTSDHPNRID